MTKVVVTGIGIISSIGNNLQETFISLIEKRTGIGKIDILDTVHKDEFLLGEIKLDHNQLIELAGVDPDLAWTRTTLLGIIAAKQAIQDSGIVPDKDTALVSATTVGGMDRSELYYKDFLAEAKYSQYIDTHHAGNSTEMIAEQCGLSGLNTTISTACSSSLNSIMFGARLIKNGKVNTAIVGGTDALARFTLNGFNTLMILDKDNCRPFDSTRMGLNLGEGAAYLVLEEINSANASGKKIYAEVTGYANANDAYHQTASSDSGEGPFLAMKNALDSANILPSDVDYINAHGTGTDNNDVTEGIAIKRIFQKDIPPFSSTKAYTGHTLGAAGAIESVISILALNNKVAFPNINFKNVIEEIGIKPVTEVKKLKKAVNVLTNSFGFGGNDSSIIFSVADNRLADDGSILTVTDNPVYIIGTGCVSPQDTIGDDGFLENIIDTESRFLQIVAPNYREFIDPKLLRRMSKIVKMGIVSSALALKEADIVIPDAILSGTGMGCQEDTEKFLNKMIENDESLLTPTSFIQSTHNTIGGSIALGQQNHNYNLTYVHRTFSFESALLDSIMLLNECQANNILLGGFDEITEESWLIKTKIDFYKSNAVSNLKVFSDSQTGAQAGEGSSFFVLSNTETKKTYAKIVSVDMFFRPKDKSEIEERISSFINKNSLSESDIDLVILGNNGDSNFDKIYNDIESSIFSNNAIAYFKHLCGEYDTASSFAMWVAAKIIKENKIPKVLLKNGSVVGEVRNILIYNHFRNINHSLILLGKP
jgi:3-oxoacyl-[acyl-carrier-protein] synthase II